MCPRWPSSRVGVFHSGHGVETDLLGVISGEKCGACRPAAGRVIKLSVTNSARGQSVEVWCVDFAAVAARVGEAHIVGEKNQKIRRRWSSDGGRAKWRKKRTQYRDGKPHDSRRVRSVISH